MSGPTLAKYQLDVGKGLFPTEWKTIAEGTTPIDQDVIAKWDAQGLGGIFTLRITGKNQAGVEFEDRQTVPLTIQVIEADEPVAPFDVAFDGRHLVVVWEQEDQVLLRRISKYGLVVDDEPVELTKENQKAVDPVIDCYQGRCIVAWSQEEQGKPFVYDIYGASVLSSINSKSTLNVDPPLPKFKVFPIATAELTQIAPEVAFNGSHYWVTWTDARNSGGDLIFSLYGTLVRPNGQVIDFDGKELHEDGAFSGLEMACAKNGNCLGVWTARVSFDSYVRGILLGPAGEVLTDPPSILVGPIFGASTLLFRISVASDGAGYFVAWERHHFGASNSAFVRGIRVHDDGTSTGEVAFFIDGASPAQDPTLTFDGTHYVVNWFKLPGFLMNNLIDKEGNIVFDQDSVVGLSRADDALPQSALLSDDVFILWTDDTPKSQLLGTILPAGAQP